MACPFAGPFKFTYSRSHGECREPMSSIDSCTEDSRLLFRFQACADVVGSESRGESLVLLLMLLLLPPPSPSPSPSPQQHAPSSPSIFLSSSAPSCLFFIFLMLDSCSFFLWRKDKAGSFGTKGVALRQGSCAVAACTLDGSRARGSRRTSVQRDWLLQ